MQHVNSSASPRLDAETKLDEVTLSWLGANDIMEPLALQGQPQKKLYFVGTNLQHAVSNTIHDLVSAKLGLNYSLCPIDNTSLDEFVTRLRGPEFGGAIVTIPHKIAIRPHLDRIDDMGALLGACNNVYRASDGALTGTNTDWIGVRDALLQLARGAAASSPSPTTRVGDHGEARACGAPAFVIGAGGAARAAVYTLNSVLGAARIYIINRDAAEVAALVEDIGNGYRATGRTPPEIVRADQKTDLAQVFYGVGTVPDFEPATEPEREARAVLERLLRSSKGVFLDMCYRPRETRNLRLAKENGWITGDGSQVVGWQLKAQWELWAGPEVSNAIPLDEMMERISEIAEQLP